MVGAEERRCSGGRRDVVSRHHQRSRDLEQRGSLDRLHVTPQVPVAVTEVAEPAAAGPGLERKRHGSAGLSFVGRADLLEQRGLIVLLGVIFLGGLALNLTPCIYPTLPVHRSTIVETGELPAPR